MDQLLQHLLNGLLLGATYSLLGIGLTLVFGLMNVVNFAHGEFYTFGAYAAFAALALASVHFFLAIPLAIVAGALAGAVCERVLLRPLRGQSIDTVMLVMIGLWIAMQNAELLGWGGVAKSVPTPFPTQPVVLGAVSVAPLRIFVFVVSGLLILGAHLLLSRTKLGRAMRATFQDRETAALMGVSIERIHTVTFAFGAGLAAAAGALLGRSSFYPAMAIWLAKAFRVSCRLGNFAARRWAVVRGSRRSGRANLLRYATRSFPDDRRVLRLRPAASSPAPSSVMNGSRSRSFPRGVSAPAGCGPVSLHTLIRPGSSRATLSLNSCLLYRAALARHAAFSASAPTPPPCWRQLEWSPWIGLLAAIVLPGLAGYVIGRLALKLRGAYFVLLTISFAGCVSLVSVNWMDLTNGPLGIPGVPPVEIALPGLSALSLRSKSAYYYLCCPWWGPISSAALIRSRVGVAGVSGDETSPPRCIDAPPIRPPRCERRMAASRAASTRTTHASQPGGVSLHHTVTMSSWWWRA